MLQNEPFFLSGQYPDANLEPGPDKNYHNNFS